MPDTIVFEAVNFFKNNEDCFLLINVIIHIKDFSFFFGITRFYFFISLIYLIKADMNVSDLCVIFQCFNTVFGGMGNIICTDAKELVVSQNH